LGSTTPQQPAHHYAPVPTIPAPPSPAMQSMPTPVANDIVPQLQNIVSTVNMGCILDLKKIALQARNAEYNPRRFAAVIMRIRDPRTTALIFRSGKMVCTGAKSEEQSRLAARKYARIIQKLGFPTKFKGLVLTHSQFSSYEPELFPGLIYRMVKPKIVLLIFVSGKVVLTVIVTLHTLCNQDSYVATRHQQSSNQPTLTNKLKHHTNLNIINLFV